MSVAIGIPTYNGAERLDYLLQSITLWTHEIPQIAILDDGSPPLGARRIRDVCEKWKVKLLEHEENLGIAKSWNDLTNHFDSEVMVLLNDDVLVSKSWLKCLVYFLENNKCGSASLPFYFIEPEDAKKILRRETVVPREPITKKPALSKLNEIREEMAPGILMCPAGNVFGFKREMYNLVGGFDERFKSFFEESDFGTKLAQKGYKSYGLTYPMLWHVWSQTFRENPELEAQKTIRESHNAYIEKWGVPEEFFGKPFDYTNPKFMSKISKQKIKWMGANGKLYEEWDS
jgi:GT2 family glycosyltransferase